MPSMKMTLIIALAIGVLISSVLLVLESPTGYALLSLEWPGITAAYFFWGATGGSALMGVAISWVVNALAYALGAFIVISAFRALSN